MLIIIMINDKTIFTHFSQLNRSSDQSKFDSFLRSVTMINDTLISV